MPTEPSGLSVVSPKIRDQALVRRFVSQYGSGYLALDVRSPAGSVDPDEGTLRLRLYYLDPTLDHQDATDPRGAQILDVTDGFNHPETGKYDYDIGPYHTANRGVLTAQWSYQVGGVDFTFVDHLQVLNPMPMYDSLDEERRSVVEQVSWMFGDLYDSTEGGPHLIDEFQSHFDYERIALLMGRALTRMNTTGMPVTSWDLGAVFSGRTGSSYPPSDFTGLLTIGTYLEVVRHLRDSYVEIPTRQNMNVTFLDRSQYSSRWNQILATDFPEWQRMVKMQKRSLLNLGRGSLLVAGGIYGGAGRLFMPGTYAASVRAWKFYPAAPSIALNSTFARGM